MHRLVYALEDRYDRAAFALKRRMGWIRPVRVMPYLGHSNGSRLYLRGRVLEENGLARAREGDSKWVNFRMAYRRFTSNEIPHVWVRVCAAGSEQVVEADSEGYFQVALPIAELPSEGGLWRDLSVELLDEVVPGQGPVHACGRYQVVPADAEFGVISDVDDTVLRTGATNFLRMARITLFHNARTRLPFEGVAAFYRALQQGHGKKAHNPIFYVSSSPWNLYDLLVHFLELQEIPAGTLFLRDLGLERSYFVQSRHHTHKLEQIEHVFAAHAGLPFVLIGDSGQHDPEIYQQVVQDFPGRVRAIYIREVTSGRREAEVRAIARALAAEGVPMALVKDTAEAVRHAVAQGIVPPALLEETIAGTVPNPESFEEVAESLPSDR